MGNLSLLIKEKRKSRRTVECVSLSKCPSFTIRGKATFNGYVNKEYHTPGTQFTDTTKLFNNVYTIDMWLPVFSDILAKQIFFPSWPNSEACSPHEVFLLVSLVTGAHC